MFREKRLFILIPTIVLVSLLLAITPVKLVYKTAHAAPFTHSQSKHECISKNCISQSLISQNTGDAVVVDAKSMDADVPHLLNAFYCVPESVHSNIGDKSIPLRC